MIRYAWEKILFGALIIVFSIPVHANETEKTNDKKAVTQRAPEQSKSSTSAEEIDSIVVEKQSPKIAQSNIDSKDNFIERLHSAGYSRVRSIKKAKSAWSANALNSRGVLVRVVLQADTGAINETTIDVKK